MKKGWAAIINRNLNKFTSIVMGTGMAYAYSVLAAVAPGVFPDAFRTAEALEVLEKVDTLVVDKTGTLTKGKTRPTRLLAAEAVAEDGLLRLAASLERGSAHPLAAAIVAGAEQKDIELLAVQGFDSMTGKGVTGSIEGRQVALCNLKLLEHVGVEPTDLARRVDEARVEGETVMFVAVDAKVAGLIGMADPIKKSTPEVIRLLHGAGVRIVMMIGDNRTTGETVTRRLSPDEVEAEVLPKQKGEVVKRLQQEGRTVVMAGDGINDAPALAQAHMGIVMGTGTDVAVESAGVTLLKGDLRGMRATLVDLIERCHGDERPDCPILDDLAGG